MEDRITNIGFRPVNAAGSNIEEWLERIICICMVLGVALSIHWAASSAPKNYVKAARIRAEYDKTRQELLDLRERQQRERKEQEARKRLRNELEEALELEKMLIRPRTSW